MFLARMAKPRGGRLFPAGELLPTEPPDRASRPPRSASRRNLPRRRSGRRKTCADYENCCRCRGSARPRRARVRAPRPSPDAPRATGRGAATGSPPESRPRDRRSASARTRHGHSRVRGRRRTRSPPRRASRAHVERVVARPARDRKAGRSRAESRNNRKSCRGWPPSRPWASPLPNERRSTRSRWAAPAASPADRRDRRAACRSHAGRKARQTPSRSRGRRHAR